VVSTDSLCGNRRMRARGGCGSLAGHSRPGHRGPIFQRRWSRPRFIRIGQRSAAAFIPLGSPRCSLASAR
jgi:hypothetical protein